MSPSGECIETRNSNENVDKNINKLPLEMMRMKEKSNENVVLDNRLPALEPPDLIPKLNNLNRKSCSVQDVREVQRKPDFNRSQSTQERYRMLPVQTRICESSKLTYNNQEMRTIAEDGEEKKLAIENIRNEKNDQKDCLSDKRKALSQTNLLKSSKLWQIDDNRNSFDKLHSADDLRCAGRDDCLQQLEPAILDVKITRTESDVSQASSTSQSSSMSQTSSLSQASSLSGPPEEKPIMVSEKLQRVQSNQEKRLSRSDSMRSTEDERIRIERSKSLKLVERSTSFGRTDSMRLVQRPLTKNKDAVTSDAASQTDLAELSSTLSDADRRKLEEEMECDKLSRDLVSQLPHSDRLQELLAPAVDRKKPTDYVAGLFRLDVSSRPRRRNRQNTNGSSSSSSVTSSSSSPDRSSVNGHVDSDTQSVSNDRVEPLPSSSPYFTTSESKAKLLTQFNQSMESLPMRDSKELQKKKEELMNRLGRKLEILREEQIVLSEECLSNEELGVVVANQVSKLARPHEASKYRLHVEEVGKITSLLLGLSGRLARAENALLGLPTHHVERKIHESKRDKLQAQLKEAKLLKENIDRRSEQVSNILSKYLSTEDYEDYHHYIHMKAKLIVDAKEIADKISLGEEQLAALKETFQQL